MLPNVASRVFMKLPWERSQNWHPNLSTEWDGPFRVVENSENSALIARIGREEDPLRIQMDLSKCAQKKSETTP